MSVQALTWAFNQDLHPSGLKFVLVALANYASEDLYCYPSQKTLAFLTGQSERAVRGHLLVLEGRGFIRRSARRKPDGAFNSDGFYLLPNQRQNLPEVESADGKIVHDQRQILPVPAAESAANTKEDTKGDTKEGIAAQKIMQRAMDPQRWVQLQRKERR